MIFLQDVYSCWTTLKNFATSSITRSLRVQTSIGDIYPVGCGSRRTLLHISPRGLRLLCILCNLVMRRPLGWNAKSRRIPRFVYCLSGLRDAAPPIIPINFATHGTYRHPYPQRTPKTGAQRNLVCTKTVVRPIERVPSISETLHRHRFAAAHFGHSFAQFLQRPERKSFDAGRHGK